jgi:prepilin peptidase CpaA
MGNEWFWYLVIAILIFSPLMVIGGWFDYHHYRVPNILNLTIAGTGLLVQGLCFGLPGIWMGLEGLGVGFLLLFVFWVVKMVGPGDVKFLAAIGTWLGPNLVFWAFVIGVLIGAVIGLGMIIFAGRVKPAARNVYCLGVQLTCGEQEGGDFSMVRDLGPQSQLIPYSIPLSLGALVVGILKVGKWW